MAKKNEVVVEIRPLELKTAKCRIVGDTPLIVHAWGAKGMQMMLDAQMGKTKGKAKPKRDPFDDFIESLYWIEGKPSVSTPEAFEDAVRDGAKWGFPVTAIKQASNSAAYRLGWVKNQMELRSAYFLQTEFGPLAEIRGSVPNMRQDVVRIGMGTADLRFRGEFEHWYIDFEQILNCINAGGFACGIGEWRPEKDGDNGRYHVETI